MGGGEASEEEGKEKQEGGRLDQVRKVVADKQEGQTAQRQAERKVEWNRSHPEGLDRRPPRWNDLAEAEQFLRVGGKDSCDRYQEKRNRMRRFRHRGRGEPRHLDDERGRISRHGAPGGRVDEA